MKETKYPPFGPLRPAGPHGWAGTITIPGWGKGRWPAALRVVVPGGEAGPDAGAASLAAAVVGRGGAGLTDVLVRGIWAELTGEERRGGVPYAGDLDALNERLGGGAKGALAKPDDLLRVLRPEWLSVIGDFHGDGEPVVVISFACDFAEEHGLDVLTDGERVLGTGPSPDATRYERAPTGTRRKAVGPGGPGPRRPSVRPKKR